MAEPSANLRVRISADLADIRQGLGVLTRQLREVRGEASRPLPTKNPISDLGISAGQTAQAMRQLPAQFTDIFTSLQGGMPFFTVLVQQGGQIKDSFGGVEPALKGVSSALLGMVNPYTVAAAAVGVLVYAWYDAEKQQEAYTKALVLSRNEAAATTLTLVTLAQRTSEAMQVSAGAGEEAALAIGSNGRIAERNMQAVANAAVAMKEITGQSIEETVSLYAKLAEDPVKNAAKLNEKIDFMTVALYEQVKALQEQGRNQDAATVITRASAGETDMALARVRASQNPVIRGWRAIWSEATRAWGAMQASTGAGPQAEQMQQLLLANQRDVATMNKGVADGMSSAWVFQYQQRIQTRAKQIKDIAADISQERKDAELKAAQAASLDFVAEMDGIIEKQESKVDKKRAEIGRINGEAEIARRKAEAAGLTAEVEKIEERRAAAVGAIEKKYKEKSKSDSGSAARSAGLQGYKDDLVQEHAMSTFTERRQRTDDTAGILLLLELSAPSFVEVLRIVNDTTDWVSQGKVYTGFPFGFKLPDDVGGQAPRAQLVLDNVGRSITEDLEGLQPGELVTARLMITDRVDPNVIEASYDLPMTQVVVNTRTASAQLGVDFLMRQQAVTLRANPFTLPGIF